VPTLVLLILLMALGMAFAYYQDYQNQQLLARLDAEIASLQPRLTQIKLLDAQILDAQKKLEFLTTFNAYPQQDLDTVRELTRVMPMTSYISRMDLSRTGIGISGEIEQSMELLKMLDSSPFFKDSEFTSSPVRNQLGKEMFQLRAKREFGSPAPVAQPSPAPVSTPIPKVAPPPPLPPGLKP
jgi:Tfp pilus assembly protein PilN